MLTNSENSNLSAEVAALGSCLCGDLKSLLGALAVLRPEHFTLPSHSRIFAAIHALHRDGKPVDPVLVAESLDVSDRHVVFSLAEAVPSALNAEYYAKLVRRKFLQDRFSSAAKLAAADPEDERYRNDLRRTMQDLSGDEIGLRKIHEVVHEYFDVVLNDRITRQVRIFKTGFPSLDADLLLEQKKFVVVGARTSKGKTAFLLRLTVNFLRENHRVLFVSAEMSSHELMDRIMAMDKRHELRKIRSHNVRDILPELQKSSASMLSWNLVIREGGRLSVPLIEADIETARPDVVILDYAQRIRVPPGTNNRAAFFSDVANELKAIAMEKNILVITGSQLSRDSDDRQPTLADFKESGGFEEASDAALLIHWSVNDLEKPTAEGDIMVAKQRNGPVFQVPFIFMRDYVRFEEKSFDA